MIVKKCDLCDQVKDCAVKEIDGREYDICPECWAPLEQKLSGKGRKKDRVYIPPPVSPERKDEEKPRPGEPPKIWCSSERVH